MEERLGARFRVAVAGLQPSACTATLPRHGGQLLLSVRRLFFTEKTPDTVFACMPAMFFCISFNTMPSSVTFPFSTMMWIGGTARMDKVCKTLCP